MEETHTGMTRGLVLFMLLRHLHDFISEQQEQSSELQSREEGFIK